MAVIRFMVILEHVLVSQHYYFVCKTKCICGICLWAVTYISYNVLQDSATYADMSLVSNKTR